MRRLAAAGVAALGVLGFGGTCSAPPPWHDVSGSWVAASSDDDVAVTFERGGGGSVEADIGVVMVLESTVPEDRGPLPVEGWVCVSEDIELGVAGSYSIDPEVSTWAGSDYGGARLDGVARAGYGQLVEVAQAFMVNSSPDELENAIITFAAPGGDALGTVRFEDFRRADAAVRCP